jgi:ABC-type transport system involved in multi-copper enzyme maturation permease subunit
MSDDVLTTTAAPADAAPPPSRGGTWGLGWSGVRTVALLELRQRIRSTRWVAVLVVWTAILAGLTFLVRWGIRRAYVGPADDLVAEQVDRVVDVAIGRMTFGVIVFLVLSLAGLVAPALSATSINGDRQAGVLATLQTTMLTPAEIVVGKLLAAWVTALALLAAALPFLLWVYLDGGTPFGRLVVVLAVLATTLLVVCAVGLGWSALTSRTSSSAVLTYLTIALLGPGLPLLFALSVPLVTQERVVPVRVAVGGFDASTGQPQACRTEPQARVLTYTNRSWWLLAASPYVVVADAAPRPPTGAATDDPLTVIRDGVREARLGPRFPIDECTYSMTRAEEEARAAERDALGLTWPAGLGALLALGAGFTALAVRRLRTPTRRLPAGTRVA